MNTIKHLTILFFTLSILSASAQSEFADLNFASEGVFEFDNGFSVSNSQASFQHEGWIYTAEAVGGGEGLFFSVSKISVSGVKDLSFGNGGVNRVCVVLTEVTGSLKVVNLHVQPNNKILLVLTGNFITIIVRINANGSLDTNFGANGFVQIGSPNSTYPSFCRTIDSYLTSEGNLFLLTKRGTSADYLNNKTIIKLNNNGSLDTSFSGDGYCEMTSEPLSSQNYIFMNDVSQLLYKDNKILIACSYPPVVGISSDDFSVMIAFDNAGMRQPIGASNLEYLNLADHFITDLKLADDNIIAFGLNGSLSSANEQFVLKLNNQIEYSNEFGSLGLIEFTSNTPPNYSFGYPHSLNIIENQIFCGVYHTAYSSPYLSINKIFVFDIVSGIETALLNYPVNQEINQLSMETAKFLVIQQMNNELLIANTEMGSLYFAELDAVLASDYAPVTIVRNIYNNKGAGSSIYETPNGELLFTCDYQFHDAFGIIDVDGNLQSIDTLRVPVNPTGEYTNPPYYYSQDFNGEVLFADDDYFFGLDSINGIKLYDYNFQMLSVFNPAVIYSEMSLAQISRFNVVKSEDAFYVFVKPLSLSPVSCIVFKFNLNFQLDANFGDLGHTSVNPMSLDFSGYSHFIILDNNDILMFGSRFAYGPYPIGAPDFALCTKILSSGDVDYSYGDYGNLTIESFNWIAIYEVVKKSNGEIICLLGLSSNEFFSYDVNFASHRILKLTPDGQLIESFNDIGYVELPSGFFASWNFNLNPNVVYSAINDCFYAPRRLGYLSVSMEIAEDDVYSDIIKFNELGEIDNTFYVQEITVEAGSDLCNPYIMQFPVNYEKKFSRIKLNFDETKLYAYSGEYCNGSIYRYFLTAPVYGCTDPAASNYSPDSNADSGDCVFVSTTVNSPTCAENQDGSIELDVDTEMTDYSIVWSTGQSGANIGDLAPGSYTYSIVNSEENIVHAGAIEVPAIAALSAQDITIQPSSSNPCDGSITIVITGGTEPYDVSWNIGTLPNTNFIEGLCEGIYQATVTDANSCVVITNEIAILSSDIQEKSSGNNFILLAQPNPSQGIFELTIDTGNPGLSSIFIYNEVGHLVDSHRIALASGVNKLPIDISKLSAGNYFVELVNGGKSNSVKIVLEK